MSIIRKLKGLLPGRAPTTSGARKAASGQSDLTEAASVLKEMRGDNITAGDATGADSSMDNLVKKAKGVRYVNFGREDDAITKSNSYRDSK